MFWPRFFLIKFRVLKSFAVKTRCVGTDGADLAAPWIDHSSVFHQGQLNLHLSAVGELVPDLSVKIKHWLGNGLPIVRHRKQHLQYQTKSYDDLAEFMTRSLFTLNDCFLSALQTNWRSSLNWLTLTLLFIAPGCCITWSFDVNRGWRRLLHVPQVLRRQWATCPWHFGWWRVFSLLPALKGVIYCLLSKLYTRWTSSVRFWRAGAGLIYN